MIKGSSFKVIANVYLDRSRSLANVAGSTVQLIVKKSFNDSDALALFSVNGVVSDASTGEVQAGLTATQTNTIKYPMIYWEIVVKLLDGSVIRSGVSKEPVESNVLKAI